MYLDIWDNGANGTPVNVNDNYALYVYRVVSTYQSYVKFWEIWNEPDLTVEVTNVVGQLLTQRQIVYAGDHTVYNFDCSGWAKGSYLVKVRSDKGVEVLKVVVE